MRGEEGWKKNVLGGKNRKTYERGGTSIRHARVGNKSRHKMILLSFWIKLTQKGYFRTKKNEIIIEFYIFKLI